MATYEAQCSAVGGFGYANYFKLYVVLTEVNVNIANNTSQIQYNVFCQSSGSGAIDAKHFKYFNMNDQEFINTTEQVTVSSPNAYISIVSGTTGAITHNADGSKQVGFSAQIKASSYGVSASLSGVFTLSAIPRYANLTSLSVQSRTVNSVTLKYTTDRSANLFCSIDGGTTWLNTGLPFVKNTTSGTFTIYYKDRNNTQKLDYNTSYTFTILCRNANVTNVNLDTSKTISVTTYDIAKISSATSFNLGDSHEITYSNAMGSSISALDACISFTGELDDISYRSISKTGTSYKYTFTDAELDKLYKRYGTGNTITAISYLRTTHNGVLYYSTKNINITLTGNQKTIRTNVSGSWKRGKLWTNVNGTWKRGVLWTNVNGTWKRGI